MLVNKIVKPNHKGQDEYGRVIDWSIYRGRAVSYNPPTTKEEGRTNGSYRVVWFRDAKLHFGKFTNNYPACDLIEA